MKNVYLTSLRSTDIPNRRLYGGSTFQPKVRWYLSTYFSTK